MTTRLIQWILCICLLTQANLAQGAEPDAQPIPVESSNPVISCVSLHGQGTILATAGDDHLVRIWDLTSGKQTHQLAGHTGWVRTSAFVGQSNTLITAGDDGRIIRWDVVSGKQLDILARVDHAIWRIAVNPKGTQVAASGFSNTITVVDLMTAATVQEMQGSTTDIRGLAYSSTGLRLASGGRDGLIHIWSTETGQETASFVAHHRRIRDLCYLRQGSRIVSISDDRTLHVGCLDESQKSYSLPLGKLLPMAIAVCSENQVAVGASDNQIHLWNIDTRQETRVYQGHTGSVVALDFKADEKGRQGTLISGSYDTSIRSWQFQPAENSALRVSEQTSANRK
ncbi:MAG: WD40 repeat domain-containing protein [Planctomycetota bacterium]|nr:WD40 repeat domain-containing protein [Planctomycetota bacterium]